MNSGLNLGLMYWISIALIETNTQWAEVGSLAFEVTWLRMTTVIEKWSDVKCGFWNRKSIKFNQEHDMIITKYGLKLGLYIEHRWLCMKTRMMSWSGDLSIGTQLQYLTTNACWASRSRHACMCRKAHNCGTVVEDKWILIWNESGPFRSTCCIWSPKSFIWFPWAQAARLHGYPLLPDFFREFFLVIKGLKQTSFNSEILMSWIPGFLNGWKGLMCSNSITESEHVNS